jgi:(p)ppGpp synthase/HD superfamily hydrolase
MEEDLGISTYPVDIEIYANDRPGLLADLLSSLEQRGRRQRPQGQSDPRR